MTTSVQTSLRSAPLALVGLLCFLVAGSAFAQAGADWPVFGGDAANTKYSSLDQIDASNFASLEIAWEWESVSTAISQTNPKIRPGQFKAIPIAIDGVLYVATEISQVAAIDAGTGKALWTYDPESWKKGRPANIGFQHRGVSVWKGQRADGSSDVRVFIATQDRKLVSLDGVTGEPVGGFGEGGVVDLLPESGLKAFGRKINWRLVTHTSPAAIVGDVVIVGSIIHDGAVRQSAPPGFVRGFSAVTGELLWTFHTIPQNDEFGASTWENESWKYTGNTNVWSMMAVDEELGYVYLPVSTPTNDFYGGHRLGDNLFAESIVCLDAKTGERVWHFQAVHHGLWDYDFPTAPNLVDIEVDGRKIAAVAQVSKQGFTYVFDRKTGEPVWPIEERAVPQTDVPGERSSPTQPFPTKPPPFERQGMTEDNLIDLTPEIKAAALKTASQFRLGPLFTPPTVGAGTIQLPGAGGGANWPGAAVDPVTGVLYVPSMSIPSVHPLSQPDAARSNLNYVGSFAANAGGPGGLPLVKPPWGRVTAIALKQGELKWMTPNGVGPRSHPLLKDLDLPMLGNGAGAPLLTKTLLFVTQSRGFGEGNTPRINVFHKDTGELLGHIPLPDNPNSNPVTFLHEGRQMIAVSVGGGPFFGGMSKEAAEDAKNIDPEMAEFLKVVGSGGGTTPKLVAFRLPR